jgi:hypothetical protein
MWRRDVVGGEIRGNGVKFRKWRKQGDVKLNSGNFCGGWKDVKVWKFLWGLKRVD